MTSDPAKLRVGTDCSGIEAPIQALQQLGIPFSHEFSSEINPHCIKSIVANYDPKILFGHDVGYREGDITKRDIGKVPDVDLYVCGFPCQPFSYAGYREGSRDIRRGTVFEGCLKVIHHRKPKFFILENVPGLLSSNKGKEWSVIKSHLQKLVDEDGYSISWKILDTKDYGIPQSRKRLFIVGKRDGKPFVWPKALTRGKPLSSYVDYTNTKTDVQTRKLRQFLSKMGNKIFVDYAFSKYSHPYADKIAPCIAANSRVWCVPQKRKASTKELLQLQGFPKSFKQCVSDAQLKHQIGNSMSVNVLKELIKALYK